MLIPLTDPEHPLAKQMLQLIGAHSHLPKAIGAEATVTRPSTPPLTSDRSRAVPRSSIACFRRAAGRRRRSSTATTYLEAYPSSSPIPAGTMTSRAGRFSLSRSETSP